VLGLDVLPLAKCEGKVGGREHEILAQAGGNTVGACLDVILACVGEKHVEQVIRPEALIQTGQVGLTADGGDSRSDRPGILLSAHDGVACARRAVPIVPWTLDLTGLGSVSFEGVNGSYIFGRDVPDPTVFSLKLPGARLEQ